MQMAINLTKFELMRIEGKEQKITKPTCYNIKLSDYLYTYSNYHPKIYVRVKLKCLCAV